MLKKAGLLLLLGFIVMFSVQAVYDQPQLTITSYSISGTTLTFTLKNTGTTTLIISTIYVDNLPSYPTPASDWTMSAGTTWNININNEPNLSSGTHNIRVVCTDGTQATYSFGIPWESIVGIVIVVIAIAVAGYFVISRSTRSKEQETPNIHLTRYGYETPTSELSSHGYDAPTSGYVSLDSPVYQLTSMGFEQAGTFWYSQRLQFALSSHKYDSGVYAFVSGDNIKYIGKAHNLNRRMIDYQLPSPNDRNYHDRNINQNLTSSGQIQILFLSRRVIDYSDPSRFNIPPMTERLNYHIVEDILINRYKPPWNVEGSKD